MILSSSGTQLFSQIQPSQLLLYGKPHFAEGKLHVVSVTFQKIQQKNNPSHFEPTARSFTVLPCACWQILVLKFDWTAVFSCQHKLWILSNVNVVAGFGLPVTG